MKAAGISAGIFYAGRLQGSPVWQLTLGNVVPGIAGSVLCQLSHLVVICSAFNFLQAVRSDEWY